MSKLEFEYICNRCEVVKLGKEMSCMVCDCGGSFELVSGSHVQSFKPFYSESHNVQVNTASEFRRFVKRHGPVLGDYPDMRRRQENVRKHREDIIADRYAKVGLKYPKGKNVNLDEKTGRFIPRH